jgi:cytochrome P450 family 4
MGQIFFRRSGTPWLYSDNVFRLLPLGKQQQKDLDILHGLTRSVIRKRKQELLVQSKFQIRQEDHEDLGEEC